MGKVNVFYTQETYHNLLRYHRVNMIPSNLPLKVYLFYCYLRIK